MNIVFNDSDLYMRHTHPITEQMYTTQQLQNACEGKTYSQAGLNAKQIALYLKLDKKVGRQELQDRLCLQIQNNDLEEKVVPMTGKLMSSLRIVLDGGDTETIDADVVHDLLLGGLVQMKPVYKLTDLGVRAIKNNNFDNRHTRYMDF